MSLWYVWCQWRSIWQDMYVNCDCEYFPILLAYLCFFSCICDSASPSPCLFYYSLSTSAEKNYLSWVKQCYLVTPVHVMLWFLPRGKMLILPTKKKKKELALLFFHFHQPMDLFWICGESTCLTWLLSSSVGLNIVLCDDTLD